MVSIQSCVESWLTNEAVWGVLLSLILWQSQINRVSISMAVWPLSHFKSEPFWLFDLTSISHVIDSPTDLFFSPISDSVSTFSPNPFNNTRCSSPALLLGSQPPTTTTTPSFLSRLRLVSDPTVFLPLWPLMIFLVSNLIFFFRPLPPYLGWLREAILPMCSPFLSNAHSPYC